MTDSNRMDPIDVPGANRQAMFFDGSPVPTFVIDADHVVTHLNKACALTLGVTSDEVIGSKGIGQHFYVARFDRRWRT